MNVSAHRARLFELRRELEQRLADLNKTVHMGLAADSEDRAAEIANDEVRERLRDAAASELRQVDHALVRMQQGAYGTCERCGRSIEESRLDAYPMAADCVVCSASAPDDL